MIKSFVGPMHSGKSDALISIYNKIWNKSLVCAFKPRKDERDKNEIRSKNYEVSIPAIYIDDLSEIKQYVLNRNIRTIFIDEAQMLTGDVSEIVDMAVLLEIDFYIAGLNMTSEQKPFGIMAVSDEIETITGFCQDCNKPSIYSYFINNEKKEEIVIGDEFYIPLCLNCLRKRRENKRILNLVPESTIQKV